MRNTGKTYRRVMRALVAASGGVKVCYLSNTRAHSEYAFAMACQITEVVSPVIKIKHQRVEFTTTNGFIKFEDVCAHQKNNWRGIKTQIIDELQ